MRKTELLSCLHAKLPLWKRSISNRTQIMTPSAAYQEAPSQVSEQNFYPQDPPANSFQSAPPQPDAQSRIAPQFSL